MSSTLSSLAYTKLIFHASKHPHRPVNGILVGKSVGKDVKITDAIPLLHNWTSLSPMMEVGLDVATTFVAESGNGTKIVGYYQASDRVDDTALGPVGEKVASKVKAGFADAVVLVIDGTKLGSNELPLVSYTPSQTSFRTGGSVKLSTPSAIKSTNEAVKEKQAHLTFGDFDDHLEDVSIGRTDLSYENLSTTRMHPLDPSSYLLKPPSANIGAQPSTAAPATDSPTHLDEVQVDDTMSHPDLNPGRIDLIHRGVDTSFYHKTWNSHGLNTNWSSLAGNFVFEPVSLLWGPDLVYVFGVDFSSCIQYKFLHKLTGKWSENWIELKAIRAPATAEGGESKPIRWAAKPSVISLYPKSMEIVGLGSDNNLYHGSWALGSGWSCFTALVSDIHFREPPSLTSWSAGRFDVFALGLDGNVYHKRWVKKGWSPFTHTGNSRSSSLASSTLDSEWEADIKGRGRSGLSENSKSSQSMEVSTWENLQGPFMHTPSAVSWAKGRIDLVGIAGGGKVYHKFWDEDSQAWSSKWKDVGMTSEPVGRPEIVSWGPNRLDLFIIGSDRAIYHKWLNASGNTQWEPFEQDESLLGRTLGDQVTAASIGPNNLAVFCTKMDCRMFAKSWTPDQWSVSKDTGSGYSALEGHATARIVACATRNVMFNP